jgi:hypothetical protein
VIQNRAFCECQSLESVTFETESRLHKIESDLFSGSPCCDRITFPLSFLESHWSRSDHSWMVPKVIILNQKLKTSFDKSAKSLNKRYFEQHSEHFQYQKIRLRKSALLKPNCCIHKSRYCGHFSNVKEYLSYCAFIEYVVENDQKLTEKFRHWWKKIDRTVR